MTPMHLETHRKTIMRTMRELGGHATVDQLIAAAVIPSALLREVMRTLIVDRKVQLIHDNQYVLRAGGHDAPPAVLQPADIVAVMVSPQGEAAVMQHAQKPTKPELKKRCVRCEEVLPLSRFPKRVGMVRAPRVCEECCPADETLGSPRDRARAKLPPKPDQVPGPGAKNDTAVLELRLSEEFKRHVEALIATGLYGKTPEECVTQILQEWHAKYSADAR